MFGDHTSTTFVCVPCRYVVKRNSFIIIEPICTHCRADMRNMGKHWRAPKKTNNKAWKRIEAGETLWDRAVVKNYSSIKRLVKGQYRV